MIYINTVSMHLMSFSEFDVDRRTKKPHFLYQIDSLIDWKQIDFVIEQYYKPQPVIIGRPAYPGLLLFKMLLVGIWHGGLSDEAVEDMANANLHVMRFLKLTLEDSVPDHSVLSRFRSKLSRVNAWDALLQSVNEQIDQYGFMLTRGVHVDGSLTPSQRKPRSKPTYEVSPDRSDIDDEPDACQAMEVVKVVESGVDTEARYTVKQGKAVFGYKQNTLVNDHGLVEVVVTTPANVHDSMSLSVLLEKTDLEEGVRVNADKAYASQKHDDLLKLKNLKNGIQHKAVRGKPLTKRQKLRNKLISRRRNVVERTFGSQSLWFGGKTMRYVGQAKAHAWHILQGVAYNLKRLVGLINRQLQGQSV
jgi:transposase, IS5 family